MRAREKADFFLSTAHEYHLGDLPTEQRHPDTYALAELARKDIPEALRVLQRVDLEALEKLARKEPEISRLAEAMAAAFREGGRVFFYGCGATGRLALSLETLWREAHAGQPEAERVVGFMSGGDLALVHSIESFEDHPEYGARQVREIGFGANDLLVSCTEGGETPSVIGATEEALKISSRKPWFLYCNPDEILSARVERSRRVIQNPGVEKICLYVGPMALSGSTRLQATTVLQLAAGAALFQQSGTPTDLGAFSKFLRMADYSFLAPFVEAEASAYQRGEFFLYETGAYAITILTDTTERSPTFSLPGFENQLELSPCPSLAYLTIPGQPDGASAWNFLLKRAPRPLEWEVLQGIAGARRLSGFDFSNKLPALRQQRLNGKPQHLFQIHRKEAFIHFCLGELEAKVHGAALPLLQEHLFLKMLLNAHSLLVMGRLGRIESNVMTWVRPSNSKLIDRAIRYVEFLLERDDIQVYSYQEVCHQLFEEMEKLQEGESVVLKTVAALKGRLAAPGPGPGPKAPIKAAPRTF